MLPPLIAALQTGFITCSFSQRSRPSSRHLILYRLSHGNSSDIHSSGRSSWEGFASAGRAHIHIQFLVTAVIAVRQGQVYSLVESPIFMARRTRGADRLFVVVDRVLHILDLSAVGELPEPVFQILLLDWRCPQSHGSGSRC